MDWKFAVSLLSALIAGLSVWNSWVSKKSAKAANERSERAATAAERSADASESFARVNEAVFEAGKIRFLLEPVPVAEGSWHSQTNVKYGNLTNIGTHAAYDVFWEGGKNLVNSPMGPIPVMAPGVRIPLYFSPKSDQFDTRFTVRYREAIDGPYEQVELLFHLF